MEAKTNERKYKYLEQFQADAQNIIHNIIICYGAATGMATLASVMIRDCKYDLEEIHNCQDCYYYSNAKPKDWFCQPCRPPHELVYAKQKGYSYWPAKVIKVGPQGYDVRFFGGRHERATVPHNYIQSLETDPKEFKKSAAFNKSMEELRRHQALNKQMSEQQAQEGSEPEHSNEELEEDEKQPEVVTHKRKAFVMTAPPEETEDLLDEEEQPPPKKRKKPGRKSLKGKDTPSKEAGKPTEEAEEEKISSSNMLKDEKVCSPDDNHQVTSSVDNVQVPKIVTSINASTQTSKKFGGQSQKMPCHATQTDTELSTKNCDCESKYNEVFRSFKERMETDHQKDQEKALQELSEKMQKDFEEDKQQAVARAMSKMSQELDRVRRQTEEACKNQYMDEMKSLAQKHKDQISSVKKKQWCFNCEEEAMYHCCWNTSYCSIKCQQEHWHKEHKRVCRRKR